MKNNSQEDLNFFSPKIDLDKKISFSTNSLIKKSLKVYILIFCVLTLISSFNFIRVNFMVKSLQNQVGKVTEMETVETDLKNSISKQKILNNLFNEYNQNNMVSYSVIESILNIANNIDINCIDWDLNEITLSCVAKTQNDAIDFVKNLRKDEKLKSVVYNGGDLTGTDDKFEFELKINI